MGTNGRWLAEQRFAWEVIAETTLAVYGQPLPAQALAS
jgi:hypothetical protein